MPDKKFKLIFVKVSLAVVSATPFFAFSATQTPKNLTDFVNNFIGITDYIIPFVTFFGFFGLITGVLKYVNAGGDEERLGQAKELIVYGLVGILVILSFWGIASIIAKTYLGV